MKKFFNSILTVLFLSSTMLNGFCAAELITTIPIEIDNVEIDETRNKIYGLDSANGTLLQVIDGSTDSLLTPITIRESITKAAVNSDTGIVYTKKFIQFGSFFGGEQDTLGVFVVNAPLNMDTDTFIEVTAGLEDIAVNPSTNKIYTTNTLNMVGMLVEIDGSSNSISKNIDISKNPGNIAIDSKNKKMYIATQDNVDVIDTSDNMLGIEGSVSIVGIRDGSKITANPNTERTYVSDSSNDTTKVHVINIMSLVETTSLPIDVFSGLSKNGSVGGLAINPNTNKLYIGYSDSDSGEAKVVVVDGETNTVDSVISLGQTSVYDIAVNSSTNKVYVRTPSDIKVLKGAEGNTLTPPSSTSGGTSTSSGEPVFVTSFKNALEDIISASKELNKLAKSKKDKSEKITLRVIAQGTIKQASRLKSALKSSVCKKIVPSLVDKLSLEINGFRNSLCSHGASQCLGNDAEAIFNRIEESFKTISEISTLDDDVNGVIDVCEKGSK